LKFEGSRTWREEVVENRIRYGGIPIKEKRQTAAAVAGIERMKEGIEDSRAAAAAAGDRDKEGRINRRNLEGRRKKEEKTDNNRVSFYDIIGRDFGKSKSKSKSKSINPDSIHFISFLTKTIWMKKR
jgi:hypothetical protein